MILGHSAAELNESNGKKTLLDLRPPPSIAPDGVASGAVTRFKANFMKKFNGDRGSFLAVMLILCLSAIYARADGELTTASSTSSSEADLGTGNYSHLPVRISASVRGGYDDNITTSKDAHGSPFTGASAELDYDFGSPR